MTAISLIDYLSRLFPRAVFNIEIRGGEWTCVASDDTTLTRSLAIRPLDDDNVRVCGCNFGVAVDEWTVSRHNIHSVYPAIEGRYLDVPPETDAEDEDVAREEV